MCGGNIHQRKSKFKAGVFWLPCRSETVTQKPSNRGHVAYLLTTGASFSRSIHYSVRRRTSDVIFDGAQVLILSMLLGNIRRGSTATAA